MLQGGTYEKYRFFSVISQLLVNAAHDDKQTNEYNDNVESA